MGLPRFSPNSRTGMFSGISRFDPRLAGLGRLESLRTSIRKPPKQQGGVEMSLGYFTKIRNTRGTTTIARLYLDDGDPELRFCDGYRFVMPPINYPALKLSALRRPIEQIRKGGGSGFLVSPLSECFGRLQLPCIMHLRSYDNGFVLPLHHYSILKILRGCFEEGGVKNRPRVSSMFAYFRCWSR